MTSSARAKQLGATHGVNYKAKPEWDKAVVELSEGGSITL